MSISVGSSKLPGDPSVPPPSLCPTTWPGLSRQNPRPLPFSHFRRRTVLLVHPVVVRWLPAMTADHLYELLLSDWSNMSSVSSRSGWLPTPSTISNLTPHHTNTQLRGENTFEHPAIYHNVMDI